MKNETIIERIKKMLNLAADAGAAPGEIENAMKLARKLMTEYGVQQSDLVDAPQVSVIEGVSATRAGWAKWEQLILHATCKICDVAIIYRRSITGQSVVFIGLPHDVAVAQELFPALLATIRISARTQFGTGWQLQHRSFADGFAAGLLHQARQGQAEAQAIVLRKDIKIKEYLDTLNLSKKKAVTVRKQCDQAAYSKGYQQGITARTKAVLT